MNYTKIKFERLSAPVGSVEFSRDPAISSYKRLTQFRHPKDFSDGGDVYIYDKGINPTKYRTLVFSDISMNDLANFTKFFYDTAIGSKNNFIFTDRNGSAFTARILNSDDIESEPQLADREALTIELLVENEL